MPKITLAAARINKGVTQKEAAKALGVSLRTLWQWENGVSMQKADKIDTICNYYEMPYDNLKFTT